MSRKVIIDTDPGIDDAVALCMALFDPRLEVVAVTATAGNVDVVQAHRNLQAIVEHLDPPRWPRIGIGSTNYSPPIDGRTIHGRNGLGDVPFNVAELHQRHPAEKVICDEVHLAPEEVTILALGPLTNLADALNRDPDLATMIGQLAMVGGTCGGPGNATAAAEFNMVCNPDAAHQVFCTPVTKTLIPLDVSSQLVMTYDQFDQLPPEETKKGGLLRRLLPVSFRNHHQRLGQESIHLHDAVGLVSILQPELFETEPMYGDIETTGRLTKGATVFDRRRNPDHQPNMDVAVSMDVAAVMDCIMRGLAAPEG